MIYLILLLFIVTLILSIIVFKVKGLLILIITIPLLIMYYKINNIKIKKDRKEPDNNLSEGKEVEVVSRNRKKKINIKSFFQNLKEKLKIKKEKTNVRPKKEKVKKTKKVKDKRTINDKKKKSILRKILTIILGLGIFGVVSILLLFVYIVISCGDFDPEALKNQEQTVIYDKDGGIIATLGEQKREEVDYDELPEVLIDAIIATEDSRFFEHNGVDTARFLKATLLQLIGKMMPVELLP